MSQARSQKFSKGGSFDTAGGSGAAQDSPKPLCIWSKSCNLAISRKFPKVLFFKTDFKRFSSNSGLNQSKFKQNLDFNSAYFFSRGGGSYEPLDPPPPGYEYGHEIHMIKRQANVNKFDIHRKSPRPENLLKINVRSKQNCVESSKIFSFAKIFLFLCFFSFMSLFSLGYNLKYIYED